MTGKRPRMATGAELTDRQRAAVRAMVERTCAGQGVELTVPAEVCQQIRGVLCLGRRKAEVEREEDRTPAA